MVFSLVMSLVTIVTCLAGKPAMSKARTACSASSIVLYVPTTLCSLPGLLIGASPQVSRNTHLGSTSQHEHLDQQPCLRSEKELSKVARGGLLPSLELLKQAHGTEV